MLTGAIELFLISLGLAYFMATTGAGLPLRLAAARPAGLAGWLRVNRQAGAY